MDGRVLETGAQSALYVEPTVNLPPDRESPTGPRISHRNVNLAPECESPTVIPANAGIQRLSLNT